MGRPPPPATPPESPEVKAEPAAGERAEPGQEPCRSPSQQLTTIDGLDLLGEDWGHGSVR